jgi:hypothetical protein
MRHLLHVSAVAIACLVLAPVAAADIRRGLDRDMGVRFTLNGATLKATIVGPTVQQRLFGERIDAICATSHRPGPSLRKVVATATWPDGARSMRFEFTRDISRRARWCLLERDGGSDVAAAEFPRSEPSRLVAKGRSPGGQWWRLAAWRGPHGAPCRLTRFSNSSGKVCSRPRVALSVSLDVPSCPGDKFVSGLASRRAAAVRVRLGSGKLVESTVYDAPSGSGLRQHPFMAALAGTPPVRSVTAVDSAGRRIARWVPPRPISRLRCGSGGNG